MVIYLKIKNSQKIIQKNNPGFFKLVGAFLPNFLCNMESAVYPLDFFKESDDPGKIIADLSHYFIAVSVADLEKEKNLTSVNACKDPMR